METGTYYGRTSVWASKIFKNVFTIEYSREIFEIVSSKHSNIENIKFSFGDSRSQLSKVLEEIKGPALFWLDAHWSGGLTYGDNDQCPLIQEINILNSTGQDHFILIDDARLFLSPPQPPHEINQWPSISEVINALRFKFPDKYIVVIEDVIVAVPDSAKSVVADYCQKVNAKIWDDRSKFIKQSNLQKGLNLITVDLKSRIKYMTTYLGNPFSS
ncbi:hypothetical protein [Nodosilinea sp. AN01ver1]|uniref:hypothetical protein n=1 Tax=Nodosilinea sp. AN01ver1 TaxID=3423362 RepID=UPI003D323EA3